MAVAIVAMGGGPLLHAGAQLEDELLRPHGLDEAIASAWGRGAVLGGWSAGGCCWFDAFVTDSFGPEHGAAAVFGADGLVEAIAQRDAASVWRVDPHVSQTLPTRRL